MADDSSTSVSPAEFQKIPLEFIIATPLLTTISAHRQAAQTTLEFVKGMLMREKTEDNYATFKMMVKQKKADGKEELVEKEISVPLITLVKVPSLNFDSLSVSFNYNISQISKETNTSAQSAKLDVGTTGILKNFISASLVGSVEHSRTRENTSNRGGSLEIKINVSEAPMPAGLQKIINALVENIDTPVAPN